MSLFKRQYRIDRETQNFASMTIDWYIVRYRHPLDPFSRFGNPWDYLSLFRDYESAMKCIYHNKKNRSGK